MFFRKKTGRKVEDKVGKGNSRNESLLQRLLVNPASRFVYISVIAIGASIGLNYGNHRGYWYGTIYRVQTVDFNILSHTLPTKLSYALNQGDEEEIQRTLNSNFGLFGLVVTDCKSFDKICLNERVIYATESHFEWRKQLDSDMLANSSYDFLRSMPPLHAEASYSSARSDSRELTGLRNYGEIIGRVYYVRGIAPSFWDGYTKWIEDLPQSLITDSGPSKYFTLSSVLALFAGAAAWLVIEAAHAKRRQQQREADFLLEEEKWHADQQIRDQAIWAKQQISDVEAKATLYQQQLNNQIIENRERDRQHQKIVEDLQQQSAELRRSQAQAHQQILKLGFELQQKAEELTKKQLSLDETLENKIQVENALANRQQVIQRLQDRLSETKKDDPQQQQLTQKIFQLNQQQRVYQSDLSALTALLESKDAEICSSQQSMAWLQQQIGEVNQKKVEFECEFEELRQSVVELTHQRQQDSEKIKNLEQERELAQQRLSELDNLDSNDPEEIERYRADLETAYQDLSEIKRLGQDLNVFEQEVLAVFENSPKILTGEWKLLHSFDVCRGRGASQMTDFIVAGSNFLVVIEAKGYTGKIVDDGDVLNTPWYAQNVNGLKREVRGVGKNPYQQVRNYTISAGDIVNRQFRWKTIFHYGVVVFPQESDISTLPTNLTDYYYLTKLDKLVTVIGNIEAKVKRRNSASFPASKVIALLHEKRLVRAALQR
ncbi:NERD domain-containing protein [Nodosilinea sp. LEGE 07298]|uniref:NERD domain-containing protein n=1 Tax=Nodosilinea sp. LEGE 07298 TaxID=2777970 RepID=UPI00187ED6EC|nr:NERD domain-containing protein [Nodosilinea sp. LEGE 07298]MBE9110297.1 NERD domain-containing protein [Nodosilinea sp. LEGE 07298]